MGEEQVTTCKEAHAIELEGVLSEHHCAHGNMLAFNTIYSPSFLYMGSEAPARGK